MTHHQDNSAPIALFSSCRFTRHIVAPPHVHRHTFSISLSCPLWLPHSESPVFLYRIFLKNHARLDWRLWKWGGCILKGDTIRMGAAHWREASTKGACKFLTCLAYVNELFSRSDIITARGYCLWWKYLSHMAWLPHGGEKSKEWQSSRCINSHLPCLEVKRVMLANSLRMIYWGEGTLGSLHTSFVKALSAVLYRLLEGI